MRPLSRKILGGNWPERARFKCMPFVRVFNVKFYRKSLLRMLVESKEDLDFL